MVHRYTHHVVGFFYGVAGEAVTFCAEDYGQPGFGHEAGIVDFHGTGRQSHGGGAESETVELCLRVFYPCPRHKKNRTHRDPDGATVQRVA